MPTGTVLSPDETADGSGKDPPREVDYVGPMPVATWHYRQVLIGTDVQVYAAFCIPSDKYKHSKYY